MAKGNSIKDEIRAENKKMKDMTFAEKTDHILEYYRIQIAAVAIAIVAVTAFIYFYVNAEHQVYYMAVYDADIGGATTNSDIISTEFKDYLHLSGKDTITIDYSYSETNRYYNYEKITTMASAENLDGFMADYKNILMFSNDEELFLMDLSEIFSESELQQLKDKLVYYTAEDGTQIPLAVNLSESKIKTNTNITLENPCYGIVVTTKHKDNAINFIRYALDM